MAYGEAKATSTVDIQTGALLQSADEAIVVTSDAKAAAEVKTETAQKAGDTGIAGSLAIGNNIINSTITLAQGATVDAGKTANLRANGEIKTETESKGSTFANGAAGLGFSISLSDSTIHTQVDGTVIARCEDGFLNKLEIDPTAGLNPDGTPQVGYVDYANDRIFVGDISLGGRGHGPLLQPARDSHRGPDRQRRLHRYSGRHSRVHQACPHGAERHR